MPPGAGGRHSGPSTAAHVFVIVSKTRAASATFSTAFITIATDAAFANDLVALALCGHDAAGSTRCLERQHSQRPQRSVPAQGEDEYVGRPCPRPGGRVRSRARWAVAAKAAWGTQGGRRWHRRRGVEAEVEVEYSVAMADGAMVKAEVECPTAMAEAEAEYPAALSEVEVEVEYSVAMADVAMVKAEEEYPTAMAEAEAEYPTAEAEAEMAL